MSIRQVQLLEEVSLEAELFASAMNALPAMTEERRALIGERLCAIGQADRKELLDPGFGDVEFSWWPRGAVGECPVLKPDAKEPLAFGYFGRPGAELTLFEDDGEHLARWEGAVAEGLLKVGRFVERERNADDDWCPPWDE